jgi:hypothetical protein
MAIIAPLFYWGLDAAYTKAQTQVRRMDKIERDVELAKSAALWLKHDSFLTANSIKTTRPEGDSFVFVGHTYGFNGCGDASCESGGPSFDDAIAPMDLFVSSANSIATSRVVFGGDTIFSPEPMGLTFLRDDLSRRFDSPVRFVRGNHDDPRPESGIPDDLVRSVFPELYYFEDVGGVRLVYLRSLNPIGPSGKEIGLDPEQLRFLANALDDPSYKVALVFIHHALWLVDEPVWYSNKPPRQENRSLVERFWVTDVLPILERGRVGAVFAGDGGLFSPALETDLCGIPHYLSGWDVDLQRRPAEYLQIVPDQDRQVQVLRHIMFDGRVFQLPIKQVDLFHSPACNAER